MPRTRVQAELYGHPVTDAREATPAWVWRWALRTAGLVGVLVLGVLLYVLLFQLHPFTGNPQG